MSYRALDYAVQITQTWVAAAGGEENEDPSSYVAAVSPAAITSVLEAVYQKVRELEGGMLPVWMLDEVQPSRAMRPSTHETVIAAGEVPFER